VRVVVCWAAVSDLVPLYPLYSLLFADRGLSDATISVLFAIWSTVGLITDVPLGAVADRFSRRSALVAAGALQAAGYALWTVAPGFPAFAGGFVLWALSGSLVSGALEALIYDGLVALNAQARFPRVLGLVRAAGLLALLPAAGAAGVLFGLGGFRLVGWVSVGSCLAAAVLATRLPEPPRTECSEGPEEPGSEKLLTTLRAGLAEAVARPGVRMAVVVVALLGGLDAFEEYIPLLAQHWGVPTAAVPLATLAVPLAGALGAGLGGRAFRLPAAVLAAALTASMVLLGGTGAVHRPIGLVGVAAFYGIYRMALVVADSRLQRQIDGPARATVTSIAGLGTGVVTLLIYALWPVSGVTGVSALGLAAALMLPRTLGRPASSGIKPGAERAE
jgi:MFS family permease